MGNAAGSDAETARRSGTGRTWLWLTVALGMIALGIAIILRPTTSLGVLALLIGIGLIVNGTVELTDSNWRLRTATPFGRLSLAIRIGWIVAGVFVLVFPGLTVRMIAVIVGVGLILHGLVDVTRAGRRDRTGDERIADAAFGIAGVIFGVLSLAWPDVSLLIVSIVFGARLVLGGVSLARDTLGRRPVAARTRPAGLLRRWVRTAVSIATVIAAVAVGGVSLAIHDGTVRIDDFYSAPRDVPDKPGQLIRAEPFLRGVPSTAQGWRILYTTTRGDGSAATASAIVAVPRTGDGGWPVIDWTHGTTGYAQECAPSLLSEPFESGALFVLPEIIDEGWALVATDYIGLGTPGPHPYLIGPDSAHASLDAVRAARQLDAAQLGDQTVVWGHSQGGGAALWTGALASTYAPEIELSGVAALAPASDLSALIANLPQVTGGSIFASFVFAAYAAEYSDVTWRQYVRPGAEATFRAMSERCLSGPGVLVSVLQVIGLSKDPKIFAVDPNSGSLERHLQANTPPASITAPLLIAQGTVDELVIPAAQQEYVDRMCEAGEIVDYRTYQGREHVSLVERDSPLIPALVAWTHDRWTDTPVATQCTTTNS